MQGLLEEAIARVTGEDVTVAASGRTDAGAHATHQVIAFSTSSSIKASSFTSALNAYLPEDIAVLSARDVSPQFHPRFDAANRTYRYLIWNRAVRSPFWFGRAAHMKVKLNEGLMDQAAQLLMGTHNMSSFVPTAHPGERERTILRANVTRDGDMVTVELVANGFMRQMVRAIVGTLILVGSCKMDLAQFRDVRDARSRDLAGDTAPAEGLYLVDVSYEDEALAEAGAALHELGEVR